MNMLNTVSAAAIIAFTATSAFAADPVGPIPDEVPFADISAVISLWGGAASLHSGDSDFDASPFHFGGDARVAGERWQLEMRASAMSTTDDCSSCEDGSNYIALAGHALNRNMDSTWGIFGGFSATGLMDTDDYAYHMFGGVEYARFLSDQTFFGQVGGVFAVGGDATDSWEAGPFARAGWRHFMTDDTKLEFDFLVGAGRFDDSSDNGWTFGWGAEYEQRLSGPFSIFAAYNGNYVEDSSSCCGSNMDVVDHAVTIGVRIDVNTGSLRERDMRGAGTFDIPDFHRAFAYPDEL